MVVLGGIMMLKVIPSFQDFYRDFDIQLPLVTRTLMSFSRVPVGEPDLDRAGRRGLVAFWSSGAAGRVRAS
jgi:hypothetical protein